MLYCARIDLSEGIDVVKSNGSKECIIFYYSYFHCRFKFQNYVCNGCHGLTMLCHTLRYIALITVKGVYCPCVIHGICKSQAINLLKN